MKAGLAHAAFEFTNGLRDRSLLLLFYLFPLGFYVLAGALMIGLNPPFRETVIPAMVLFALMAGLLLGLPDPIVSAREAGILRTYKIHGVPRASILILPAASAIVHLAVVGAIVTLTAPLFFGAAVPQQWLGFLVAFAASAAALASLGMLIAVISGSTRETILWSQLLFLPSVMLGGLMVPSDAITGPLQTLSELLPTTYGMAAMRGLAYGEPVALAPWGSVLVLLVSAAIGLWLALALYRWDAREAMSPGVRALALLALVPYVVGALLL